MPHLAATTIRAWLPEDTEAAAKAFRLTSAYVVDLTSALDTDASGMYYSALVSFLDAINGICSGYFSWAAIKLYYACFYSARVILAANSTAIFYVSGGKKLGKPFSILVEVGNTPHREDGVTHKVVWKLLERKLPSSPLLGQIGAQKAFEWMTDLREEVNYRNPKFTDPLVPPYFAELSSLGIARAASAYITDHSLLYALDPDHAAFAYPVECLKRAAIALRRGSQQMTHDERTYLSERMIEIGLGGRPVEILVGQGPS